MARRRHKPHTGFDLLNKGSTEFDDPEEQDAYNRIRQAVDPLGLPFEIGLRKVVAEHATQAGELRESKEWLGGPMANLADKITHPHRITYIGGGKVLIGDNPIQLSENEGSVIEALVVDCQGAADLETLKEKSGVSKPNEVLHRIRDNHRELSHAIRLPGGKSSGGYSTTISNGTNRVVIG